MLETLLLMAAAAAPPAPSPDNTQTPAPPVELVEFLGDWSEADQRQFIDPQKNGPPALPGLNSRRTDLESSDVHKDH